MSLPIFESLGDAFPSKYIVKCPLTGELYSVGVWMRACVRTHEPTMFIPTSSLAALGYLLTDAGTYAPTRALVRKGDDLAKMLEASPHRSMHVVKRDGTWCRFYKSDLTALRRVRNALTYEFIK